MHHPLVEQVHRSEWFLLLYWIFETDSCRVGVMEALPRRILSCSDHEHERKAKNGNILSTPLLPLLAFYKDGAKGVSCASLQRYQNTGVNGDQVQPFSQLIECIKSVRIHGTRTWSLHFLLS